MKVAGASSLSVPKRALSDVGAQIDDVCSSTSCNCALDHPPAQSSPTRLTGKAASYDMLLIPPSRFARLPTSEIEDEAKTVFAKSLCLDYYYATIMMTMLWEIFQIFKTMSHGRFIVPP